MYMKLLNIIQRAVLFLNVVKQTKQPRYIVMQELFRVFMQMLACIMLYPCNSVSVFLAYNRGDYKLK